MDGLVLGLDQDVAHAFGVLKTNGIGQGGGTVCHLYPTISLLSHACSSNLEIVGHPDRQAGQGTLVGGSPQH